LNISAFRERPIAWQSNPPTSRDYKQVPVDLDLAQSSEPLVDLAEYGIAANSYYARRDGLNAPYFRPLASETNEIFVRQGVAERMDQANRLLASLGIELYALSGYRPLAVQTELWEFFIEKAKASLSDPSEADCAEFASQYCSDPRKFNQDDSRTWPTHLTGGAIDATLRSRESGDLLFMGGLFDDPSEISHTAHFEKLLASFDGDTQKLSESQLEALRNRRLLFWAMNQAGFSNYAFEWWHFDFGTQLWVVDSATQPLSREQPSTAFYGPAFK